MSMTTFMIGQMIGIFCAYFGVTLLLPMVVFKRLLKGKNVINRMLFSFLIGNLYIITMVQILQLLKISYAVTLVIATVVPAVIAWLKLNKIPVGEIASDFGKNIKRVTEKHLGIKTAIIRSILWIKKLVKKLFYKAVKIIRENICDIVLHVILFIILIWCYGKGMVQIYGYSASDLPVHNYWINAMGDNNIFVAGVYPHAYHCMLYFLHSVFGFETYVLLSLFAFVQVTCLHFGLLYFLKLCCKTDFIPYIGVFMYAAGDFFMELTYSRFSGALPQEFGMIFILPCAYYGFEFFRLRYKEVAAGEKKKESWYSLFGFAMSFAMTLSAHFYNTIIVGLICVAMAIGYIFLFVRKQYFGNIVATCAISLVVAILPMGIAFATGTPLEGSLYWARSVMTGTEGNTEVDVDIDISTSVSDSYVEQSESVDSQEVFVENSFGETAIENHTNNSDIIIEESSVTKKTFGERVHEGWESLKGKITVINNVMKTYVWEKDVAWCANLFWIVVLMLLLEGLIYLLFRKTCYGAMLVSIAIYMVLMAIVLASGQIGLMKLMDPGRVCVYFAYVVPILLVMAIDGVLYVLSINDDNKKISKIISVVCLLCFAIYMIGGKHIRTAYRGGSLEMNESITCLTNIFHQEKDFAWTICSANDELRMCEERGYHYEMITLLRQMEGWNDNSVITIPTPKVYFFIEKIPLDYGESHEKSGHLVSKEAASKNLSYYSDLTPYKGENRWVTMSRMYYWAQEMKRMYPNEMKVYLETEKFVCYVLEQNTYNLLNLAIDYGYNTRE